MLARADLFIVDVQTRTGSAEVKNSSAHCTSPNIRASDDKNATSGMKREVETGFYKIGIVTQKREASRYGMTDKRRYSNGPAAVGSHDGASLRSKGCHWAAAATGPRGTRGHQTGTRSGGRGTRRVLDGYSTGTRRAGLTCASACEYAIPRSDSSESPPIAPSVVGGTVGNRRQAINPLVLTLWGTPSHP